MKVKEVPGERLIPWILKTVMLKSLEIEVEIEIGIEIEIVGIEKMKYKQDQVE